MRRYTALAWFAAALCIECAVAAGAELRSVVPVEGSSFRATLSGIDAAGKLSFAAGAQPASLAMAELVRYGGFVDAARGPVIVISDGGRIVAAVREIGKQKLEAFSDSLGALGLPLENVAGVVLRLPTDRARRDDLFSRIESAQGDHDRLILDNGDELRGELLALSDDALSFQTPDGKLDLGAERVAAIVFSPALMDRTKPAATRAAIGLDDGSRLMASELSSDQTTLRFKLRDGAERTCALEVVRAVQRLGGRVIYLSDLKPAGYKHAPFLQLSWPYRTDQCVLGGKLRAAGEVHLKGLGMHSASRLTYALDKPYARFQAEAAIDAAAGESGSVVFRVYTDDGKGTWQARFESPVVRGGEPPLSIDVDLAGAKRLSLLVDYAERGDERDYADWLWARLIAP